MFITRGRLHYYSDYCVAYVDKEMTKYYRSLLPRFLYVRPPAFPAHVTVVRKHLEVAPTNMRSWGAYQDVEVPIYYEGYIRSKDPYYWLTVLSPQLNFVRQELGLHPYRFPFNCFHLTVGNIKNV